MCEISRKTSQSSPRANATLSIPASPDTRHTTSATNTTTTTNTAVRERRRMKSALYFAFLAVLLHRATTTTGGDGGTRFMAHVVEGFSAGKKGHIGLSQRRTEWIERSVRYYSTVMREDRAVAGAGESSPSSSSSSNDKEYVELATKHYYARVLIKMGKWDNAEKIYRRIIEELTNEASVSGGDRDCDHTKLAVSTLLLALHVQRTGDVRATRSVFLRFFRLVALSDMDADGGGIASPSSRGDRHGKKNCSCSAKVLQAFALFEMKNGLSTKSLEIIRRAVEMDEGLRPVLEWKQFRDAAACTRAYAADV